MEPRLIVAYALMALLTAAIAGVAAYYRYHSHERSYARRLRRDARADAEQEADR